DQHEPRIEVPFERGLLSLESDSQARLHDGEEARPGRQAYGCHVVLVFGTHERDPEIRSEAPIRECLGGLKQSEGNDCGERERTHPILLMGWQRIPALWPSPESKPRRALGNRIPPGAEPRRRSRLGQEGLLRYCVAGAAGRDLNEENRTVIQRRWYDMTG